MKSTIDGLTAEEFGALPDPLGYLERRLEESNGTVIHNVCKDGKLEKSYTLLDCQITDFQIGVIDQDESVMTTEVTYVEVK